MLATIVNGQVFLRNNEHTGALAGQLLRGPLAHWRAVANVVLLDQPVDYLAIRRESRDVASSSSPRRRLWPYTSAQDIAVSFGSTLTSAQSSRHQ